MTVQTAAWGVVGSAATMLSRRATRKALHKGDGAPRLPRAARDNNGLAMFLVLAAAAGVMLAIADVLQEQRKHAARAGVDSSERRLRRRHRRGRSTSGAPSPAA